jgi:hypothetical protein
MAYVTRKVEVFNKEGDSWATDGTAIPSAFNVEVKKGTGKIKNSFSFKVPKGKEYFEKVSNPFINENLVDIYIKEDGTAFVDSDRLIQGTIKSVGQSMDDSGDVLFIKGDDFTEVFFDNHLPINEENKTWVELIKIVLEQAKNNNNKQIEWGTANPDRKNGTASSEFPKKNLVLNYTRVSEIIEKLTSNEFTEDGQYVYWLENKGGTFYFNTRFKGSEVAGTITEGEDNYQTKIRKKKENIKNFVIFNCGLDLNGNAVEGVYYDEVSIGKYGFKSYYATELTGDLFVNVLNTEREANISSFNPNSEGEPTVKIPTTFPYTFVDGYVSDGTTNFNSYLKDGTGKVLSQGEQIAAAIASNSSTPQYTLELNQRFTNKYNLGEQWSCNFPSRNINRPLRIEAISQKVGETSITFVEDEAKATND